MTKRVAVMMFGLVGAVLAAMAGSEWRASVQAQTPLPARLEAMAANGQLIALSSDVSQAYQQVTIVDPVARAMSVYHVDRASGEIALKSVRNIHWDLQMEEFNGVSPAPREIRSLLPGR
ncbi:MAG: hypothetical protein KDA55_22815 [Planctomycetales bacterium]|nr:hypothetical protein [Planctomycetales bacterium]MCA9227807.1 hypothetical protein [Planctomycetales bacterium]